MTMTASQAKRLGKLITRARASKDISQESLAAQLGVAEGWLSGLEAGRFLNPSPDRLVRIAEALDIEPGRIDLITRGAIHSALPGMRTYFRAKYDLTPEQIEQVERYIADLRGTA